MKQIIVLFAVLACLFSACGSTVNAQKQESKNETKIKRGGTASSIGLALKIFAKNTLSLEDANLIMRLRDHFKTNGEYVEYARLSHPKIIYKKFCHQLIVKEAKETLSVVMEIKNGIECLHVSWQKEKKNLYILFPEPQSTQVKPIDLEKDYGSSKALHFMAINMEQCNTCKLPYYVESNYLTEFKTAFPELTKTLQKNAEDLKTAREKRRIRNAAIKAKAKAKNVSTKKPLTGKEVAPIEP
jgi:hypothetical protein